MAFLFLHHLVSHVFDIFWCIQVSLVICYDLPNNRELYIHRIGRSGRFGRKGVAINFVKSPGCVVDVMMWWLSPHSCGQQDVAVFVTNQGSHLFFLCTVECRQDMTNWHVISSTMCHQHKSTPFQKGWHHDIHIILSYYATLLVSGSQWYLWPIRLHGPRSHLVLRNDDIRILRDIEQPMSQFFAHWPVCTSYSHMPTRKDIWYYLIIITAFDGPLSMPLTLTAAPGFCRHRGSTRHRLMRCQWM